MMLPLALTFLQHVLIVLFVLISILLILVILIQKGKGGGVGAAFGGMGASSLLGTKTGDFLTWVTISMVALFLVLSVIMGLNLRPKAPVIAPTQQAVPGEAQVPAEGDEALPAGEDDAAAPETGTMEGAAEDMTRDVPGGTTELMEQAEEAAQEQAQEATEAQP